MTNLDTLMQEISNIDTNKIARHCSATEVSEILGRLKSVALLGCELARDVQTLNPASGEVGEGRLLNLVDMADTIEERVNE